MPNNADIDDDFTDRPAHVYPDDYRLNSLYYLEHPISKHAAGEREVARHLYRDAGAALVIEEDF
jgi:hypothetical protein